MADAREILHKLNAANIFDLRGVVAVVTGGGTGIGLMISTTLMSNGATVYIIGPEQAQLDSVADVYNKAAAGSTGTLIGLQADISVKSEAKRLADEIEARESYITVLFNNAGISAGGTGPAPSEASASAYFDHFWKVEPKAFDDSLRTNAFSAFWLSVAFLPLLEKWKNSEGGKRFVPQIIMTSSMNGWTKDSTTSGYTYPYMMSKSAIGHFTGTLAHELLPLGIRVNGIAPGLFITPMSDPTAEIDKVGYSQHSGKKLDFQVPASEVPGSHLGGKNSDVGSLALFLVVNWFVNGETVLIDGGTLLRHPSSY